VSPPGDDVPRDRAAVRPSGSVVQIGFGPRCDRLSDKRARIRRLGPARFLNPHSRTLRCSMLRLPAIDTSDRSEIAREPATDWLMRSSLGRVVPGHARSRCSSHFAKLRSRLRAPLLAPYARLPEILATDFVSRVGGASLQIGSRADRARRAKCSAGASASGDGTREKP